jgi:hypothetical protein
MRCRPPSRVVAPVQESPEGANATRRVRQPPVESPRHS